MLIGYRTILFNCVTGFAAILGCKLSPETAAAWGSVLASFWTVGNILLRQVTTTPLGQKVEAGLIADGVPAGLIEAIKAQLPTAADTSALTSAISAFATAVEKLSNHPGLDPALLTTLSSGAAQALTNATAGSTSAAAPAAGPSPTSNPPPVPLPQPQPDPVAATTVNNSTQQ